MTDTNKDIEMKIIIPPAEVPASTTEGVTATTDASAGTDKGVRTDNSADTSTATDNNATTDTGTATDDATPDTTPEQPLDSHEDDIEGSLEEFVKREAKEAEDKPASNFSLNKTLGGVIMARMIQRQIWLVLLITVFLIIYINNRYMCQKQTVVIDKLENKLTAIRYKSIVCTSILTEKSRESNILEMLKAKGDSTLDIPSEPPFLIIENE